MFERLTGFVYGLGSRIKKLFESSGSSTVSNDSNDIETLQHSYEGLSKQLETLSKHYEALSKLFETFQHPKESTSNASVLKVDGRQKPRTEKQISAFMKNCRKPKKVKGLKYDKPLYDKIFDSK